MVVRLTKGSTPVELVKQNKRTVLVRVANQILVEVGKNEDGSVKLEQQTVYKTIKRKLRDVVAA